MAAELAMNLDEIINSNNIGFHHRDGANKKDNGAVDKRRNTQPKTEFHGTANRQISKPQEPIFGKSQQRKFIQSDVNGDRKQRDNGGKIHLIREAAKEIYNGGSVRVMVSNLDSTISNNDLIDIFDEIGSVKSASVHLDEFGRSMGMADVVFGRMKAAVEAMKQYNGVPLDGRPMKIQLAICNAPASVAVPTRGTFDLRLILSQIKDQQYRKKCKKTCKKHKQRYGQHKTDKKRNRANAEPVTFEELITEFDAYVEDFATVEGTQIKSDK